jgi:hypothetical protein
MRQVRLLIWPGNSRSVGNDSNSQEMWSSAVMNVVPILAEGANS